MLEYTEYKAKKEHTITMHRNIQGGSK